jgi:hypothetical protein
LDRETRRIEGERAVEVASTAALLRTDAVA